MRTITRRLLLGGAGVLVASGAGITAGELRSVSTSTPPVAPAVLVAALDRERALIASLQAALSGSPANAALLTVILDDHVAHRGALQTLLAGYAQPSTTSAPVTTKPPAPTQTSMRRAEQQAGAAAQAASAASGATGAALLASIAACEAGHAELLA